LTLDFGCFIIDNDDSCRIGIAKEKR